MNSAQRKIAQKHLDRENKLWPPVLKLWPEKDQPQTSASKVPARVWRSNRLMVQEHFESDGTIRLSINRTALGNDGHWLDGLTWDDLMLVKQQTGYGAAFAVEIYPADSNVVNVANMRHLWILPSPMAIGWNKS